MTRHTEPSASEIPQATALRLQLAMIAGNAPASSYVEIRPLDPPGRQVFVPVRDLDSAVAAVQRLAARHNVYVGAAPRASRSGKADAVKGAWCLWADIDTAEAVDRLQAFRPPPNLVISSGTEDHVHAWWQLSSVVAPDHAVRANRRLALALGADLAATDAARVMRAPGTVNRKHHPPTPVECVRLEVGSNTLAAVVHGLRDDPRYIEPPSHTGLGRGEPGHALRGLVRVVREAPVGRRNEMLNWAAYRAAEHAIDPSDAGRVLLAAALQAGLGEREAQRTLASGFTAAGRRAA